MRVVGVTGRIGAGKSTLARLLARHPGVGIIDADRIGHAVLRDSEIKRRLTERFGAGIADAAGRIVRARLGALVFDDSRALADLNAIVHPCIATRIEARLAALRRREGVAIVLIDAALLLDWTDRLAFDRIVAVTAPDDVAVARLRERGLTEAQARGRLARARSEEDFRRRADDVIDNSGSPADLEREADRLLVRLLGKEEAR